MRISDWSSDVCSSDLPGFRHCFLDGVEHRKAAMSRTALARRHAANHLRPIGDGLLCMEGALRAGKALADHLGILVPENRHLTPFICRECICSIPVRATFPKRLRDLSGARVVVAIARNQQIPHPPKPTL